MAMVCFQDFDPRALGGCIDGVCGTGDCPLPDLPRETPQPVCRRKKCAIWTRWRPVPVKNVNYPRAPSSRRSGLVGPHTTPPIVNYKYMTSTL